MVSPYAHQPTSLCHDSVTSLPKSPVFSVPVSRGQMPGAYRGWLSDAHSGQEIQQSRHRADSRAWFTLPDTPPPHLTPAHRQFQAALKWD